MLQLFWKSSIRRAEQRADLPPLPSGSRQRVHSAAEVVSVALSRKVIVHSCLAEAHGSVILLPGRVNRILLESQLPHPPDGNNSNKAAQRTTVTTQSTRTPQLSSARRPVKAELPHPQATIRLNGTVGSWVWQDYFPSTA